VNHHQWLALLDLGTHLFDFRYTDRKIDLSIFIRSSPKKVDPLGNLRCVDGVNVSALWSRQFSNVLGSWKLLRIIDITGITTLGRDDLLELR
jgi:hypothetical protein